MSVLDTLSETFKIKWRKWIVLALILASLQTLVYLPGLRLAPISTIVVAILLGIYEASVINSQEIKDFLDTINFRNLVLWIKGLITSLILTIPIGIIWVILLIIIAKSILASLGVMSISSTISYSILKPIIHKYLGYIVLLVIVTCVWGYITSSSNLIAIIKDSISEGLKHFYKITLTIEYFIEFIKVLILDVLIIFGLSILAIIPVLGSFILGVVSTGVSIFTALYLSRVVKRIGEKKNII